jgi:hypothetical protein
MATYTVSLVFDDDFCAWMNGYTEEADWEISREECRAHYDFVLSHFEGGPSWSGLDMQEAMALIDDLDFNLVTDGPAHEGIQKDEFLDILDTHTAPIQVATDH